MRVMSMNDLSKSISADARVKIGLLFPLEDRASVERILIEQLNPALRHIKAGSLDRWHFAALKLSEGTITKLHSAVALGQKDWRDLLVAANFGTADAYRSWQPAS
jgi:hypothetical protein